MSLWTPSGEHRVDRQPSEADRAGQPQRPGGGDQGGRRSEPPTDADTDAESRAQLAELRRQLAETPAEVVVANHAYGLFELATVYLSETPPVLDRANLAIDAMGCIVDGLGDRLSETHAQLKEALTQVRVAYVRIAEAERARSSEGAGGGPNGSS